MRRALGICITVALVCAWTAFAAEPDRGPSYWMKKKLEYSERLLGGLTSGDFDEIGQGARSMNVLTHLERWVHANQTGYREQLKVFQNANERLIRAADKNDLDGATEAFNQLTVSCVNCHKVVRDARRTK